MFASLLVLYAVSMPHTVTLEDSGVFIAAARFAGIAHPPGYPLYTMLGKIFTLLPLGSVAYRLHLLSALCGALAGVMVYLCAMRLTASRVGGLVSALLCGVSSLFWAQSITAEVYALHALFFFGLLFLCLVLERNFDKRVYYLTAFCFGLSLSNHYPLMILSSGVFVLILLPRWRPCAKYLAPASLFLLLGLTPYAYIYLRSFSDPYISAYGMLPTLEEFWWYLTRSQYKALEASPLIVWDDDPKYFVYLTKRFVAGFFWPVFLLILLGFVASWKMASLRVAAALLFGALASTLILRFFLRTEFDLLPAEAFYNYQMVAFGLAALYVSFLFAWLEQRFRPSALRLAALGACGALIVGATFFTNLGENWRRDEAFAFDFAKTVLESLPPDAALFTFGDTDLGPLAYANLIAGIRPDVTLYSQFGFVFGNRLFLSRFDSIEEGARRVAELVKSKGQVFFSFPFFPLLSQVRDAGNFTIANHGIYTAISLPGTGWRPGKDSLANMDKFLSANARDDKDPRPWEYHRMQILGKFCAAVLYASPDHEIFRKEPICRFLRARALLDKGASEDAEKELVALKEDDENHPKELRYKVLVELLRARLQTVNRIPGQLYEKRSRYQEIADEAQFALAIFPTCDNQVVPILLQMKIQAGIDIGSAQQFETCDNLRHLFSQIRK